MLGSELPTICMPSDCSTNNIEFLLLSFKYCFITDPSQSWSDPRVFRSCPQDSSKDGSKEPESGDKKEGGS